MSEHLLDDLHVSTGSDRERRGRVPKPVRHKSVDPDRASRRFEHVAAKVGRAQHTTLWRLEYQLLRGLARDLRAELFSDKRRHTHPSPRVPFRRAPDQFAIDRCHGLGNLDSPCEQVEPGDA